MSTSAAFRPTTTATLLDTPDGTVDEFGDPTDNDTVTASGVPISIIQQTVRQFLPAENRLTNITTHTGRLRGDVAVKATTRIRDEATSDTYLIEGITRPQDPMGAAAIRLDLRKLGPILP